MNFIKFYLVSFLSFYFKCKLKKINPEGETIISITAICRKLILFKKIYYHAIDYHHFIY